MSKNIRKNSKENKKGIVLVGPGYKYLSGISYYVAELGNQLQKETQTSIVLIKNLCPKIIYPGKGRVGKHDLSELNISKEVKVFDNLNWYLGFSFLKSLKFIKKQNPETVVLSWWTGTALHYYMLISLWCKLQNINVVLEFHEVLDVGEARIPLVKPYVKLGLRLMEKLGVAGVVHSSIDSDRVKRELNLNKMNLKTVHHGPVNLIKKISRPVNERNHSISENPDRVDTEGMAVVNLLYFGVIREYKGVDLLLRAYKEILEKTELNLATHLTIAGEVWENENEIKKLLQLIPEKNITFINKYLDETEVEKLFDKADLIVLPYRRSSASGPLHMAISAGIRTLTSDIPALVEASSEYEGISYFKVGDIQDLQEKILESLPESREVYSNPYTWEKTRENYLKAIRETN